ncbi:MAG: hypothetical protein V3R93_02630 [Candidatus Hydrothermarchaeaceae archaeon]
MVKLKEPITRKKIEAFSKKVIAMGGKIELVTGKGTFIINVDYSLLGEIKKMNTVKVVGGVNVRRRKVSGIKS